MDGNFIFYKIAYSLTYIQSLMLSGMLRLHKIIMLKVVSITSFDA